MNPDFLSSLFCPSCGEKSVLENDSIKSKTLVCTTCKKEYPVLEGIPCLIGGSQQEELQNAQRFYESWSAFDFDRDHHLQQFLDWIHPMEADQVKGKRVLEVGCGKGRHTRILQEWGPDELFAIDLGKSIFLAGNRVAQTPPTRLVQADILHIPVRGEFDIIFAIGVLHHLPDPIEGFRTLAKKLKPGGKLVAWIYGRENNGWIIWVLDPIRKVILSRLPRFILYPLCLPISLATWCYSKLASLFKGKVPYGDYMVWLAKFDFLEIHNIVYDQACPTISHYLPGPLLKKDLGSLPGMELRLSWYRRMSWRVVLERKQ